jgi:DNA-binding transcriptional LysR family regulator
MRGNGDRLGRRETPSFIGFDNESDFVAEAEWLAREFGDKRFSFRGNTQTSQAAAARAGYGVALLPRYLAANDRRLVQVSLGERLPVPDIWLLLRRNLTRVPRIRAVADYLIDLFRREKRLLAG